MENHWYDRFQKQISFSFRECASNTDFIIEIGSDLRRIVDEKFVATHTQTQTYLLSSIVMWIDCRGLF